MRCGPRALCLVVILALVQPLAAQKFHTDAQLEKKIASLMSQMTLEEKIGQLTQFSGSKEEYKALIRQGRIGSLLNVTGAEQTNAVQRISVQESRLKIPLLLGFDVIHGYRTIFPIPLAEASSWDPDLVEQASRAAAREASAAGVRWTFAPMVDIARDPRWGRIAEGSGEDPYLGSVMAAARVRGFQGKNLSDSSSVVACAKHFVAYGGAEGGRDYNTVDISEKTLREIYLPPFHAAVEAGVGTLMSAFHALNGVPTSANGFTLNQVLRKEWGFQGFVVSDWAAIAELMKHGVAENEAQAGQKAITAGVDMDMEGNVYSQRLAALVRNHEIPEKVIDEAVRRILAVKFSLGLFENAITDPARERAEMLSQPNLDLARKLAQESAVLLKNQGNLLPLSKTLSKIAVIGPLADDKQNMLGTWAGKGRGEDVVTVLEGIRAKVGAVNVLYAKGTEITGDSQAGIAQAVDVAKQAQVVVLVLGESREMSGEAASRAYLGLPGKQQELMEAVWATGVPVVLVLVNGRPLTIPWAAEHVSAILESWFLGVQAGNAVADILFGDANPSGKLPVTFPRTVGQIPLYYNHLNTGRPTSSSRYHTGYFDESSEPLFPFGFGLSYAQFKYSNLALSSSRVRAKDTLQVAIEVENVGQRSGDEIVQLYIRQLVASTSRPVRELKGFRRVSLAPGEKKTVRFSLGPNELGSYNSALRFVVEPGTFHVWVGPSSAAGEQGSFEVAQD